MSFRSEDGLLVPESSVPHFQLFFRNVPRSAGKRCAGKGAVTICRLGVPMQPPETTSGRDIRARHSGTRLGCEIRTGVWAGLSGGNDDLPLLWASGTDGLSLRRPCGRGVFAGNPFRARCSSLVGRVGNGPVNTIQGKFPE